MLSSRRIRSVGITSNVAPVIVAFTVAVAALLPLPVFAQATSAQEPVIGVPVEPSAIGLDEPLFVPPLQDSEAAASPSFGQLFRSIGNDFKSFPTQENFAWLTIGAGLSGLTHGADDSVTAQLSSSSGLVSALEPGKTIGGPLMQMGGAFTTYAIGRMTDSHAVANLGADLVRAQVLTQGVVQGIKFTAQRTRPDGTNLSFPSGHTASAFATGTVLQRHFGWKVGVPAYALATYVGASRLSENRHYLSDVMFGAMLGILAGKQVTVPIGGASFSVTPQVVPGGAAISFAHIGG